MDKLKPLIVILGPTASGKTGMALELAREFDGELINADSRQIYKEMDIATNKIGKELIIKKNMHGEMVYFTESIPLYLLDLINPDQEFSLAQYKELALAKIKEVQEKGRLPILIGGTGLYISAIVDNLQIPEVSPDKRLREKLDGIDKKELFSELRKVDPVSAKNIGSDNKRKIIRALEVYETTGRPFSAQQKKGNPLFNILQIGIKTERELLYSNIDQRVEEMIKLGLVKETEQLLRKYNPALPAMSGIGYKEIGHFLRGELPLPEAVQQIKFHTHQYARRQITWFKRDCRIHWIKDYKQAKKLAIEFLR